MFFIFSKKTLFICLALLVSAIIIVGQIFSAQSGKIDGSTNAKRVEYLKELGFEPDDSRVTFKNITVPQEFSAVYKQYNNLQKESGFDLTRYKGKKATVYTYALSGRENEYAHLIVSDNIIIGGDIACAEFNGEMKPLIKK